MGIIHRLDKDLIPKIAAGEVIEGPASAIKELIENSIDASADKITVEITGFGFDSIRITDNGRGMSSDDLDVCFQTFYTSKITTVNDLHNIKTLGFRGEALSSLCAVSSVSIKSRTPDRDIGNAIEIRDGRLHKKTPAGMNVGTIVEAVGLFKHVPARQRFIKDPKLEFRKTLDVISTYALCYPAVSFKLYRDGKLIINLSKGDKVSRYESIIGAKAFQFFIPVSGDDMRFTIEGYISKPQVATGSQDNQYLFVNNRYVILKNISRIIKKAYGTLLPHDAYPQYVLFINISPDLIDVNVHPKKLEVNFWDDAYVNTYLEQLIKNTLEVTDLTHVIGEQKDYRYDKSADTSTFMSLKDSTSLWKADAASFDEYENVFQIANTYIATPIKEGLLLIDQHAAHESILYEELYNKFVVSSQKTVPYKLVNKKIISFGIKDASILSEYLDTFNDYGFELYQVSPTEFNVAAIPEILKTRDIESIVKEMLQETILSGKPGDLDSRTKKTIAFLACRTAIKAGDFLSDQEQRNIFTKLNECKDLYTCPHGRPIRIVITTKELARLFKRIS